MRKPKLSRRNPARRGTYLIPSLFTMANVFCGYYALTEAFKAGLLTAQNLEEAALHFDYAAIAIGFAVLFDGLDGRIARLMKTTSPFGKELDSLADTITFGIAPAFLAFSWGVRAVLPDPGTAFTTHLASAGWLVSFLFVICSAARLARFNIQSTPGETRPERLEHKHFVGLPTPAAAGMVAAIVHVNAGMPMRELLWVPFWLLLLLATAILMVSTWRYYSFKDLDLRKRHKFAVVIVMGTIVGLIWFYSQPVLLLIATTYLLSGVVAKVSHSLRRGRAEAHTPQSEVSDPHSEVL
ncbi:MAG: phosphatidylcholine/phosphatidylserine synthase [Acidobacteria bacterium]|nr:phosphatidylcholine/phosphatidylserine synthase [Acidobacteriota bacterium]